MCSFWKEEIKNKKRKVSLCVFGRGRKELEGGVSGVVKNLEQSYKREILLQEESLEPTGPKYS